MKALLVAILFICASSISFARSIEISAAYPIKAKKALIEDLNSDWTLKSDPTLEKILGVPDLKDATLKHWLTERVGFILAPHEKIQDHVLQLGSSIVYPFPKEFPEGLTGFNLDYFEVNSSRAITVGSNLGVLLYFYGKFHNTLMGYKFASDTTTEIVNVTSPRVGIIRLSDSAFSRLAPLPFVERWLRIVTLFNLARNSDGAGKNAGFTHSVCPQGHIYGGFQACDNMINGSYGIETYMLRQVRTTCTANKTCDEAEAEKISLLYVDAYSRIIKNVYVDPTPENVIPGK